MKSRSWNRFVLSAVIATSLSCTPQREVHREVSTGIDELIAGGFDILTGKNIGLVTNHTAVCRDGRHTGRVLQQAPDVNLVALFAPEHGVDGRFEAGKMVEQDVDTAKSLPIYSIYGENNKPTAEMLTGIDMLIFDIQDVGTRFYTYISTLWMILDAAAEHGIPLVVLDRPNPISGAIVEGPVLKPEWRSFVGIFPIALRHGMTVGELANMFNQEGGLEARVTVVKMKNWQRNMFFDATGLEWIKPSPNMTCLQTALLYPGMGLLEATSMSEGRGTSSPFRSVGAPWMFSDREAFYEERCFAGVTVDTSSFVPQGIPGVAASPRYEGERCFSFDFYVDDPPVFRSVEFGIHLLCFLRDNYPHHFTIQKDSFNRLAGDERVYTALMQGKQPEEILALWRPDLADFVARRSKYLLY